MQDKLLSREIESVQLAQSYLGMVKNRIRYIYIIHIKHTTYAGQFNVGL